MTEQKRLDCLSALNALISYYISSDLKGNFKGTNGAYDELINVGTDISIRVWIDNGYYYGRILIKSTNTSLFYCWNYTLTSLLREFYTRIMES